MLVLALPNSMGMTGIKSIGAIDGDVVLSAWPSGSLRPESTSEGGRHLIRFVLPDPLPKVNRGVCIQVEIQMTPEYRGESCQFAASGCEFTY